MTILSNGYIANNPDNIQETIKDVFKKMEGNNK